MSLICWLQSPKSRLKSCLKSRPVKGLQSQTSHYIKRFLLLSNNNEKKWFLWIITSTKEVKACQNLISGIWGIMTDKGQRNSQFSIRTAVCCVLTMPCSGTAAWTLRLTTWARAGQCCGGLKPLLGSVPLVLVVGTLAGWPRVSYTFMCSLFPCLAALWERSKQVSLFTQTAAVSFFW